jgi:biopolymer transport protein ExbD
VKVKRRHPPAPHIPFISLADIAWQIIIFFFMASSFTQLEAMKIDAPGSTSQGKPQETKSITVEASSTGLSIDGKTVAMGDLSDTLVTLLKDRTKPEDRVVIVDGRKGLTWQRNAEVLYAITHANATPMVAEEDDEKSGAKEAK